MYLVRIKTQHNTIYLKVDDMNTQQMKEILNQPYIEEVYIQSDEQYKKEELEKLKEEKYKALSHVVGTAYYNEIAQQKNEEIKKLIK